MKLYGEVIANGRPKGAGSAKKLTAHLRTCVDGIAVEIERQGDGRVLCWVYRTGGSDNPDSRVLITNCFLAEK